MLEKRSEHLIPGDPVVAENTGSSEFALLGRMSHEMRNPLSAILGFAQLMETATPSPTLSQKKSLDLILRAGWHLEKLIDMTRDLALIESGSLSLSLNSVPLAAVMLDCAAMIESEARLHGVPVTFPSFETPCFVSADRNRLQQVLGNVLSAAVEHGKMDGALIVHCDMHGSDWVRIGIAGVGGAGTDIGLLLAKRLIEMMGGVIGPERMVGSKNVFAFDLKRLPANTPDWPETLEFVFSSSDTRQTGLSQGT